jgi:class 3 adenylate cyclase
MAFEMMDIIKSHTYGENNNQKINMKIGIHYGRVIAGVIGSHKP